MQTASNQTTQAASSAALVAVVGAGIWSLLLLLVAAPLPPRRRKRGKREAGRTQQANRPTPGFITGRAKLARRLANKPTRLLAECAQIKQREQQTNARLLARSLE